ncbi:MAG: UvrD-helicase domain-containing protein [Gammaproteobacteria bacterium]|nr:UvrD-helicase domain-containing protein [Gammaproteobacteria bacterium]
MASKVASAVGRIADHRARARALDSRRSFIVQAPAGSGKTELLMQRFLVLLATVESPEEIVAITFTRKASAEMRQRILQALESARTDEAPEGEHEHHIWTLARKALERDAECDWQLLDHPARLRIQTIDSLCAALARQMPMLSQFGAVPEIAEDAQPLYLEAARNTLFDLESDVEWSDSIAVLMQHLDNRLDRLQGLVCAMLGGRDRWLRHIARTDDPKLQRRRLEAAMAQRITMVLAELARLFPAAHGTELARLARFAASHQPAEAKSAISCCKTLRYLPGSRLKHRGSWEGIAELLLTQAGEWRKSLTKRQGFPPKSSGRGAKEKHEFEDAKACMESLLHSLDEHDELREKLCVLRALPSHRYEERDWEVLQALVQVLRVASAHLEVVFSKRGQVDFTALVLAAIRALGEPEAPTDLALALDYRIQHLLVDEFQDTSYSQYELLVRLTAGWQPNDGRTLFVVGDPMQSIYRFREAEVGLFLAAARHGIGQVVLHPLRLTVNFRSQQGIVDWINQYFPQVLPARNNIDEGAVSYAKSAPFHPPIHGPAVAQHLLGERHDVTEAGQVLSLVRQARTEFPQGSVAILVRARTHLTEIAVQLKQAGFRFQAVEIESLNRRTVIQDLLALARALSHPGDRIAWLAVLRAPYCGLTLADLHALVRDSDGRTVIDLLGDVQCRARLSEEGQMRIERVGSVLETALCQQARRSLRSSVEGAWIALGGPACMPDRTGLEDAESFFRLLETIGKEGDSLDITSLEQQVEKLFATPDVLADVSLQLMTIHKAKGLEFDTVILPGLSRVPSQDDSQLLHWLEYGDEFGQKLVLAPISAQGEESAAASYLRRLEKIKRRLEDGRLLYVAVTRAKQRLHLLAHIETRDAEDELIEPPQDSLLAHLYPHAIDRDALLARPPGVLPSAGRPTSSRHPRGRPRLAAGWQLPEPPASLRACSTAPAPTDQEDVITFDWAGETARYVGTVMHRLLQHIGAMGLERLEQPGDVRELEHIGYSLLKQMAVPEDRLEAAFSDVCKALQATLADERGRWVLSGMHSDAGCELALSSRIDERVEHIVIDRTFVDEEGMRWIIDYKASTHKGGSLDEFLDREQERYCEQLERYANVMARMGRHPIRLGLYFPLLNGWREWTYAMD